MRPRQRLATDMSHENSCSSQTRFDGEFQRGQFPQRESSVEHSLQNLAEVETRKSHIPRVVTHTMKENSISTSLVVTQPDNTTPYRADDNANYCRKVVLENPDEDAMLSAQAQLARYLYDCVLELNLTDQVNLDLVTRALPDILETLALRLFHSHPHSAIRRPSRRCGFARLYP